jgi:hypothetical protein
MFQTIQLQSVAQDRNHTEWRFTQNGILVNCIFRHSRAHIVHGSILICLGNIFRTMECDSTVSSPLEMLGHPRASPRVTLRFSGRQTVGSHSNKSDNCTYKVIIVHGSILICLGNIFRTICKLKWNISAYIFKALK